MSTSDVRVSEPPSEGSRLGSGNESLGEDEPADQGRGWSWNRDLCERGTKRKLSKMASPDPSACSESGSGDVENVRILRNRVVRQRTAPSSSMAEKSIANRGLYGAFMTNVCICLRDDEALGTLASLMRVSKTMYDTCAEHLYRHLEIRRNNIMGILWGLPYIPPHCLHGLIVQFSVKEHALPAVYSPGLPAILEQPYAPWMSPSDVPFTAPTDIRIPTGASVERKVALLRSCRRLTIWECPSSEASTIISSNYSLHAKAESIFHGVKNLRIACGVTQEIGDYYSRLSASHPFVKILERLRPEIVCVDSKSVWTYADLVRARTGLSTLEGPVPTISADVNTELSSTWRCYRPAMSFTCLEGNTIKVDCSRLRQTIYHNPNGAGLVKSNAICTHQLVLSQTNSDSHTVERLRQLWAGATRAIGTSISNIFCGGRTGTTPAYDLVCAPPEAEKDNEGYIKERRRALLEDIQTYTYLDKKDIPLAAVAKRITFSDPDDRSLCPCCGE